MRETWTLRWRPIEEALHPSPGRDNQHRNSCVSTSLLHRHFITVTMSLPQNINIDFYHRSASLEISQSMPMLLIRNACLVKLFFKIWDPKATFFQGWQRPWLWPDFQTQLNVWPQIGRIFDRVRPKLWLYTIATTIILESTKISRSGIRPGRRSLPTLLP